MFEKLRSFVFLCLQISLRVMMKLKLTLSFAGVVSSAKRKAGG